MQYSIAQLPMFGVNTLYSLHCKFMSSWYGDEICNLQKKTASIGLGNAQIKYFSPFSISVRLQQPASTSAANPFTVEEALYVLGKNILGKNVTDRIFPVAKTIAKGVGQVGQGLSTFGELLPPVEFDGSPLKLLPGMHISST